MPLLFAVQQFSEGFIWLSFTHPEYLFLRNACMYVFLFFAEVAWPVFIPLVIFLAEKDQRRNQWQALLLGLGLAVGSYMLYSLLVYKTEAIRTPYHIRYELYFPQMYRHLTAAVYILVSVSLQNSV